MGGCGGSRGRWREGVSGDGGMGNGARGVA